MRASQGRSRPPPSGTEAGTDALADPVEGARAICDLLPGAIARAEAAGLTIIAQNLSKALHLARRIVASADGRGGGKV